MIIKELNYIETTEDNSIQGGATGSAASVTVVGIGPTAAAFGAAAGGLSFDAFPPLGFVSFDVAGAAAGAVGAGLLGFGGNAAVTVVTV